MLVKLDKEQTKALLFELRNFSIEIFNSEYEAHITEAVLKIFVTKLMKQSMDLKPRLSITLDPPTMRALQFVLARITPPNSYHLYVTTQLLTQIDIKCATL
ncbi:hypothetical protein [Brumimicrobium mesophilum]|uniref:hypothetical protein n=1 Tax=Brumimicrobium mesophilum TaxID=392717 RepID=UPI000D140C31|nr:hypothetical protein [Brumimicrobium mesophilum]